MKKPYLLLSILSGVICWLAWPTMPLTPLIFIAFTPLLYISDKVQHRWKYFGLLFLAFLIWNVASTWWVGNTTIPMSGVFANCFNALLMSIPWLGFKNTKRKLPERVAYLSLIVYWLTFEYIHQTWEFSWPWLVLGHAFALRPGWIQWYEFTGTSGGTFWVLFVNIVIYNVWKRARLYDFTFKQILLGESWKPVLAIGIPLVISSLISPPVDDAARKTEVVIVQPNIDPYDEKFSTGSSMDQLGKFIHLTEEKTDSNTRYIIWPETALFPQGAWEHDLNYQPEVIAIREMLRKYPKAKLISGAATMKHYTATDEVPTTARTLNDGSRWDAYNSAVQIDTSRSIQIYHKYELVPGAELVPYVGYLSFMQSVALDFGGISGSYGRMPGVEMFTNPADSINVFPVICYESVFSNYMASHIKPGANLLVIITNDGWWGNTEGHRQHLQYARIRAIETRRWIARCANTGISAVIDPAGNVHDPQPYWKQAVFKATVTPETGITFYVKNGDLVSKAALIFCILLVVHALISRFIPGLKHAEINQ